MRRRPHKSRGWFARARPQPCRPALPRCPPFLLAPLLAAPHDLAAYLSLLRTDGRLVMVGLPPDPLALPAFAVTARRRVVAGSAIGSVAETQARRLGGAGGRALG